MTHPLLAILTGGLLAGALNALGGGGSFVTLPILLASGLPAPAANAIGTVGLLPGGLIAARAFAKDLSTLPGLRLRDLIVLSLLGGGAGAALLIATPTRIFDAALPWLVLVATAAFATGSRLRSFSRIGEASPIRLAAVQVGLSVHTGHFGGGVGITMVAAWSLTTKLSPARANALRARGELGRRAPIPRIGSGAGRRDDRRHRVGQRGRAPRRERDEQAGPEGDPTNHPPHRTGSQRGDVHPCLSIGVQTKAQRCKYPLDPIRPAASMGA